MSNEKKRGLGIRPLHEADFIAASNWSGKPTVYDANGQPIDTIDEQPDGDHLRAAGFKDPNPSSMMGG